MYAIGAFGQVIGHEVLRKENSMITKAGTINDGWDVMRDREGNRMSKSHVWCIDVYVNPEGDIWCDVKRDNGTLSTYTVNLHDLRRLCETFSRDALFGPTGKFEAHFGGFSWISHEYLRVLMAKA